MKKRIIAVMCIILSMGLLFGESDTNASTKSPLIYAGSENITGGKYTLGQKSRLRLNIKNKKQYKKITFRTENFKKIKIDKNQPQSKRQAQFLKQVGNPYMLRRGSMMIKVSFANNGLSMEQAFENLLLNV